MSSWRICAFILFAAALGVMGCGSSSSSGVSITVSPTTASVITNRTQQFSGLVTGSSNTAVKWALACETGVTANTCGSIDAAGLYTAPGVIPTIPATGTATTPTQGPTVTITATAQADTSKTATATLTIVTGISIIITPTSATVGTTETFPFSATVTNPGCNITSNPTCNNVTWSVSTTLTGVGSIGSNTGVYTAPGTVPSPSTVIITATSVADTSVSATATVTVVTATDPTVTSVSPNTAAVGGLFQDVYITGTNFISTNIVYVNGAQLSPTLITQVSSSLIRARIPDFILAAPPASGALQIEVSKQSGSRIGCPSSDTSLCRINLTNARPGVVGPNPDRISQGTAAVQSFNVDGGFFGTGANPASPAVTATFNGQLRGAQLPASGSIGSTRQLSVLLGGGSNSGDFTVPGLYPVSIQDARDTSKFAVTNLAVQPNYSSGSSVTQIGPNLPTGTTSGSVKSSPNAVAINPATGIAVVANPGSNDVTLFSIDPAAGPPAVIGSICTFDQAIPEPCPTSTPSGPTSIAIDDTLGQAGVALVANAASNTVVVIDLHTKSVTAKLGLQNAPAAVTVNPVTHQGLVAMQGQSYGVLVQLACPPSAPSTCVNTPGITGIVSITTGTNPKVAVEPRLNWAVVSPGGSGPLPSASLAIVDLSNQSNNTITAISRTTNVVTVTVSDNTNAPPLAVAAGDTVDIVNVNFTGADSSITALAPSFDGFYTVSSVGPGPNQFTYTQTNGNQTDVATQATPQAATGSVSSSEPVAVETAPIDAQGIAINPETQQAALVDPTTGGVVTFFSLIDQLETSLTLSQNGVNDVGTNDVAYNPLTDTLVAVNSLAGTVSVIDPTTPNPARLKLFQLCTNGCGPSAVAVDPGTNMAVVANQADNSISVLSLGPVQAFSISDSSPKTFITTSTLGSSPNPTPPTITVVGTGLTCTAGSTALQIRLDGSALSTTCPQGGNRTLSATVPFSMLLAAHRYALDVFNPSNGQVTNAEDFTVEQSIDVSSTSCPAPEPAGIAIDPQQNLAAVTLFQCNSLALINLSTGTGSTVTVGTSPVGVAVLPRLHTAVVANIGGQNSNAGTASIVDELQQSVKQTVPIGSGPLGAAADEATGEVAIANSIANTISVVNAVTGGASTISTAQQPVAVAFNYINHQVAAAASTGNQLNISGGTTGSANQSFSVSGPTSVIFDPVPTDCGSNNSNTRTTANTTGCFIVSSSLSNLIEIVDPVSSITNSFRLGINPSSIAYNYFTSTLVSTNTASHTITVADLLGQRIRAVLPLPPVDPTADQALTISASGVPQYAIGIHPLTNVAVIADTPNGRVLFVPLPR